MSNASVATTQAHEQPQIDQRGETVIRCEVPACQNTLVLRDGSVPPALWFCPYCDVAVHTDELAAHYLADVAEVAVSR